MFIKKTDQLVRKINVNEERETISIHGSPREFEKVLNSLRKKYQCFNQSIRASRY